MIKQRDTWSNPYNLHSRQDGLRTGSESWRDQQDLDDGLDAAKGIVHALVVALLVWAGVGIVVAFCLGWFK